MTDGRVSQDGIEALFQQSNREIAVSQDGIEALFQQTDREIAVSQDGIEVLYTDTDIVAEMRVSQVILEILYAITVPAEPDVSVVTVGCPDIQGAAARFRPEGSAVSAVVQGAAATMRPRGACQ